MLQSWGRGRALGRALQGEAPEDVTDTIILPAAIRGSSRKALLVFFGFSPAHQTELGIASTDLLGQAEMWSGQGDELALSSLCAGGS